MPNIEMNTDLASATVFVAANGATLGVLTPTEAGQTLAGSATGSQAIVDATTVPASLVALDGRLDAAEGTIATHTTTLSSQGSAITALQGTDTALDGRLDTAEGEIDALQAATTADAIAAAIDADASAEGTLATALTGNATAAAALGVGSTVTFGGSGADVRGVQAKVFDWLHAADWGGAATVQATLKARAGTRTGQQAITAGHAAPGDGGGGLWVWDHASTATANEGTIVAVTGVSTGRWFRVYTGPASVKWFGVKGDNSANDTAAIALAITSGLKWLHFPKGIHLADNFDMDALSNVTVTGDGFETVIKHTGSANPFANDMAGHTWARMNACTKCVLSGLRFQSVSGSKGTFAAIASTECTIERCHFDGIILAGAGGYAHFAAIGNTRNRYLSNKVDGAATATATMGMCIGFYANSDNGETAAMVEGNVIANNSGTSLTICGWGNRLVGNTIRNGGTSGSGSGIITAGNATVQSRDNVISHNTVDGVPWSCIQHDSIALPDINTQITNNNLSNFGLHGVQVRECKNVTITDNNISKGSGAGTDGIFVAERSYGWSISDNNLYECGIYLLSGSGSVPIGAGKIENNTLYSAPASNAGIMVQANNGGEIKDVAIRNNLLVDMAAGNHTYRTAIAAPATASGVEFSGNRSSLSTSTPYVDHVGTIVDGGVAVAGASLGSAANAINTSGKYPGKLTWNIATQKLLAASGATDVSAWIYLDGSGSITPS